jgi:hypothetical protein
MSPPSQRRVELKNAREDSAAKSSKAAREFAASLDCDAGLELPNSGRRA